MPHRFEAAAWLIALTGVAATTAAWRLYQNPAMGLLLETFRFCG